MVVVAMKLVLLVALVVLVILQTGGRIVVSVSGPCAFPLLPAPRAEWSLSEGRPSITARRRASPVGEEAVLSEP